MRLLTLTGLAALTAAGLLAAAPSAAFGDDGAGTPVPAPVQRAGRAEAPQADRLQQALAACRARGFADGSNLRRCAERLLGGAATPAPPTTTAPPAPPTTTAPPPGQPGGDGQPADRLQQALAACRARGFAEGSERQRRCAERLLGGAATPATTTPPPAATTTAPRPPTTTAPPAPRGPVVTDRGIVQSAAPDALVLRALDGSSLTVSVDGHTRVYVGDRPAAVVDIQPGSVATVRHQQVGPALDIRVALPPKPKLRTDRGITESVSVDVIVITLRDGTTKSIAVGRSTRVQASNGRDAPLSELREGLLIDVLYDPTGAMPAQSVKIIRRVP